MSRPTDTLPDTRTEAAIERATDRRDYGTDEQLDAAQDWYERQIGWTHD